MVLAKVIVCEVSSFIEISYFGKSFVELIAKIRDKLTIPEKILFFSWDSTRCFDYDPLTKIHKQVRPLLFTFIEIR